LLNLPLFDTSCFILSFPLISTSGLLKLPLSTPGFLFSLPLSSSSSFYILNSKISSIAPRWIVCPSSHLNSSWILHATSGLYLNLHLSLQKDSSGILSPLL
jgi:hypothetical protein